MTDRRVLRNITGMCLVLALACSSEETPALPDTEASQGAGTQQQEPDTAAQEGPETELMREVFSYRGTGRDPFLSLLQSGDVRPMPEDLRVAGIVFDARYPAASIATLQDTIANERHTVRVGDILGRMRVVEILEGEVVMVVTEFGTERQVVLRERRTQERRP